jgi:hypothetical protein
LTRKNPFGMSPCGAKVAAAILASVFVLTLAACGREDSTGGVQENPGNQQTTGASAKDETERAAAGEAPRTGTTVEDTLEPVEARIGPRENSNVVPAGGRKPDPAAAGEPAGGGRDLPGHDEQDCERGGRVRA